MQQQGNASQQHQWQWQWQWQHFNDDVDWLFWDWVFPNMVDDFKNMRVLDAGCGKGQHIRLLAPYCREIVGVDLNTAGMIRPFFQNCPSVHIEEGDISRIRFSEPFDIVFSVGVIHHTDDPDATFQNLARLTKPGGKTIVWVYSKEGNVLQKMIVEPLKKLFLFRLPKKTLETLSRCITILLYPIVYTVYRLPLSNHLPYTEYFRNFRLLTFRRNVLNVFDKLNAPQTEFIERERVLAWFRDNSYEQIHISLYRGVSWRASGVKSCSQLAP